MKRLTKNNDTQYDLVGRCDSNIEEFKTNTELRNKVLNKLGQIEDLEEELGIDLITLFRALQYGIYGKSGNIVYHYNVLLIEKKLYAYPLDIWEESWDLVDYDKTWALTKEELE